MKKLESLIDSKYSLSNIEQQSINGGDVWFSGYEESCGCGTENERLDFVRTDICTDIQDECEE